MSGSSETTVTGSSATKEDSEEVCYQEIRDSDLSLNNNEKKPGISMENSNDSSLHYDIARLQYFHKQLCQIVLKKEAENKELQENNLNLRRRKDSDEKKFDELISSYEAVSKKNQELNNEIERYKLYIKNFIYPKKLKSQIELLGLEHFKFSISQHWKYFIDESKLSGHILQNWLKHLKNNHISLIPLKQFLLIINLSSKQKAYLHIETASDDLESKSQFLDFIASAKTKISSINELDDPFLNSLRLYFISNCEDHTVLDKDETLREFYFQVLVDFAKNVSNLYKFIVSEVDSRAYSFFYQISMLNKDYKNIINILFHLLDEEFIID